MRSLNRRAGAGFVTVIVLFLAVVITQFVVTDRLQADHARRADRLEAARVANIAVLQHMTDAETGVRGLLLTGRTDFLDPYDQGRAGAFTSFDRVGENSTDPTVRRLLQQERLVAAHWFYAYAIPIVNAGTADPDYARTARGKEMFDGFRAANAQVDAAIRAEQTRVTAADLRRARLAQALFGLLALAFLAVTIALGLLGRRHLLAPLEHLRATLHRLAAGDLSARAVPTGPEEMRVVIGTLNRLAAEIERLLAADRARAVRGDLRQLVALELRKGGDVAVTARRIAAVIGEALGADAVHSRISLDAVTSLHVRWPDGAPSLSARTVQDVLNGTPGDIRAVPHVQGGIAVALGGDADCPPGLLYLVRHDRPEWSEDERRLLAALFREIDHAVRQQRLHLRQARLISELRVLDGRKDAFVATVTHELRTPLTSILGYTEMLADGDGGELTALQQRGLTAILRNALRLQDTVSDLLLLDRANGTVGAEAVRVDLAAVAEAVRSEFAPVARAREVRLAGAGAPAWVDGDAAQLERALRNLLDNALKFTPAGGEVTCALTEAGGAAVLTVTDTGIGIPEADLANLFTPFHRGTNAMDQAVQGSGLGLAIVRGIVSDHGGTVAATSHLGRGSTFTITLPTATATATATGTGTAIAP